MWCATHEVNLKVRQARVVEFPVMGTHFEFARRVGYHPGHRFECGPIRTGDKHR